MHETDLPRFKEKDFFGYICLNKTGATCNLLHITLEIFVQIPTLICIHEFFVRQAYFQGFLLDVVELVDSLLLELAREERLETLELIRPAIK
jgi:hypothetical protein